jgi:hypothetical protein
MNSKIVLFAALLAAVFALPSQARAPEQRGWLLLAQSDGQATCDLDGRRVPQGSSMCRDGYVSTCNRSGRWERTSKRC